MKCGIFYEIAGGRISDRAIGVLGSHHYQSRIYQMGGRGWERERAKERAGGLADNRQQR
jgi:hypothetical protein